MVQVPLKGLKQATPSPDLLPQAGVLADGINGQNIGSASDPILHTQEKRQAPEEPIDWLSTAQGHIMLEEDEPRQKKGSGFTVEAPIHPGLTKEAQGGKIHKEGEGKYDSIGLTQEAQSGNIYEEGEEKYDDIEITGESQNGKIHKEGEEKYDAIRGRLAIAATATIAEFVRTSPSCAPQGLTKPGFPREERFTLGGMADSLYEYLIKVGHLNIMVSPNLFFLTLYRNTYSLVVRQISTKKCMNPLWKKPRNTYSSDLWRRETQTCFFRGMSMWTILAKLPLILTVAIW